MILENLRDRHPEMFGPRTRHDLKMVKAVELARKRRLDLAKTVGTGLRRIAAARLEHYANGLRALVYGPELLAIATARKDRADQLAQTGGIEASK